MTTHFRLGSNRECIDRHRDLFLFCPVFLSFSIFLILRFSFLYYSWNRGTLM